MFGKRRRRGLDTRKEDGTESEQIHAALRNSWTGCALYSAKYLEFREPELLLSTFLEYDFYLRDRVALF